MAIDAFVGGLFSSAGYAMGKARSAIRYTEAGDEFVHYGFARDKPKFDDGLFEGSFAQPNNGSIMSPANATNRLGLPRAEMPDSYYLVRPAPGTAIQGPRPVSPVIKFRPPLFRHGFGTEVRFPNGTGPGTVVGHFSL
jgi:hypothetical protein